MHMLTIFVNPGMCTTGMRHILEDAEARVTVLKFGRLSSILLAYGGQDGVVRIAELGPACTVRHVSDLLMRTCAWYVSILGDFYKPGLCIALDATAQHLVW